MGKHGPIAYTIGYLVARGYFYEMVGYDPDYAEHSPGNELLARLIEDLTKTKSADYVDFGAGDAKYKRYFGNDSYLEISAVLIRKRPYALFAASLEQTLAFTSRLVGNVLDRLQLKSRLKNFLRRKVAGPT